MWQIRFYEMGLNVNVGLQFCYKWHGHTDYRVSTYILYAIACAYAYNTHFTVIVQHSHMAF